ncbi:hypothetical protein SE91_08435 [Bradyrhizobium sp. DOA1]|nr:hypothetical protein SE91_08435 [Bradyrhizobium sp. DOA1]
MHEVPYLVIIDFQAAPGELSHEIALVKSPSLIRCDSQTAMLETAFGSLAADLARLDAAGLIKPLHER